MGVFKNVRDKLLTPRVPSPGLVSPIGSPGELTLLTGSFLANNTSDPVASGNRGHPVAVKRTSAGLYTVNLGGLTLVAGQYGVKQIVSITTTVQKAAAGTPLWAVIGTMADLAGTFQVRLENASGAATDLAAGADNRVHWQAFVLIGGR